MIYFATNTRHDEETVTKPRTVAVPPKKYKVLMHNDDYTSMDFVVIMLVSVFGKNPHEAFKIMLRIHHEGVGMCGVFPKQIAETKVKTVHDQARKNGYPLRCSIEPEED